MKLSERRLDRQFEKELGFPLPLTDDERDEHRDEMAERLKNASKEVRAREREYYAASINGRRGLGLVLELRRKQLGRIERFAHVAGYPLKWIEEIDETGESIPV
ncbi:MAG: hypothetical protein HYS89_00490 [Candidatus Colwellbacteria bacterium]|nr:hypothetical protein [Candidatus Colwellbacteria bacterium]